MSWKTPGFSRRFLYAYAKLHVKPEEVEATHCQSIQLVQALAAKYVIMTLVIFFIMEYIVPITMGYVSRFSKLNKERAMDVLLRLQESKGIFARVSMGLCRFPLYLHPVSEDDAS